MKPTASNERPRLRAIVDIARQLDVQPRTVRRWIFEGQLEAFRLGRVWRVADRDLAAFLAARRTRAVEPNDGQSKFGDEK